jgi:hypothetical protein
MQTQWSRAVKNTWDANFVDRYDDDWFRNLTPDQKEGVHWQDQQRINAWHALQRGDIADADFVSICANQARENLKRWAKRLAMQQSPPEPDR